MKEEIRSILESIRTFLIVLLVIVSFVAAGFRLMHLQIVEQQAENEMVIRKSTYTQNVNAARGIIVDNDGNVIVGNKIGYNLIFDDTYFPSDCTEGNRVILSVLKILKENNVEWEDTLPISMTVPYSFESADLENISRLKKNLNLNDYATAENCIDKFISDYEISDDYSQEEQRMIIGVRYQMLKKDFSLSNPFTLVTDIPLSLATKFKELRMDLSGINVVEEANRVVKDGNILPHEIGTVGPIYSVEEFDALNEQRNDYSLSDIVGKSGLESSMESILRGKDGTREITIQNGEVTSSDVVVEAVGGDSIKLTVKGGFQKEVQDNLENYLALQGRTAGAAVVLDVKSNAVLAMATAPTYDLQDLISDYSSVLNRSGTPLVNRATDGLYRPGSTFKTITATAGLNEGLVTGNTCFYCNRNYHFIDSWVHCTGNHQNIAVVRALKVSCNIYFYELGQRLGIDKIAEYATHYGLGQNLGLESGDTTGYLATPESYENMGMNWYVGYVLQAAIGQAEVQVTPLQMAVAASTIANKGVRYQPHLIEGIYNNDFSVCHETKEAVVADQIQVNYDYVYDLVEQGMIAAGSVTLPTKYSLTNMGFSVALKTGTPQSPRGTDSFVIGYAPADNPEIAFACVVEGGENARYMLRGILESYADYYPESVIASYLGGE